MADFDCAGKDSRAKRRKELTKRKEEAVKSTGLIVTLVSVSALFLVFSGCGERANNPLRCNESDVLERPQPEETGDGSRMGTVQPSVPEEHPWEESGLSKVRGDSYSNGQPPPMHNGYHVVCSVYCWLGFDGIWRCSKECILVRDDVWLDQE
jgi:hypothetical protein